MKKTKTKSKITKTLNEFDCFDIDDVSKVLIEKATGYVVEEVNEEYAIDENGKEKLIKKKVSKKNVPPDVTAIKTLLEMKEQSAKQEVELSDEELKNEIDKLINELTSEGVFDENN